MAERLMGDVCWWTWKEGARSRDGGLGDWVEGWGVRGREDLTRTPASLAVTTILGTRGQALGRGTMNSRMGAGDAENAHAAERGDAGADLAALVGVWVEETVWTGSVDAVAAKIVTDVAAVTAKSVVLKMRKRPPAERRNEAGAHALVTAREADPVIASEGDEADPATAAGAHVSVVSRRSLTSPWSRRLETEAWAWEAMTTTTTQATPAPRWRTNRGWISATSRSSRSPQTQAIPPRCPTWACRPLRLPHLQKMGKRLSEHGLTFCTLRTQCRVVLLGCFGVFFPFH